MVTKRIPALIIAAAAMLVMAQPLSGRERQSPNPRPRVYYPPADLSAEDLDLGGLLAAPAAVDTYNIVRYGFDGGSWQGWTQVDNTAQIDTFFHVDDFLGLGGGEFGGLVPIEGSKSVWCGARPGDDYYMCGWEDAPGYGNGWDQMFETMVSFTGRLTISYHGRFDSEVDYDRTILEYDGINGHVENVIAYEGTVDTVAAHNLYLSMARTKIRFHFTSDGAWSDQDGLWNTDGAAIIDSITIEDETGVLDFEDFESSPVGAKEAGVWHAAVESPFGSYSSLMSGLIDKDPCATNAGYQIIFYWGSSIPSPDYPGQYDTPFCKGPGEVEEPCQNEAVMSPLIDLRRYSTGYNEIQDAAIPPGDLAGLGGLLLKYTVYRHLPLFNLVFYSWNVRGISNGCPSQWEERHFVQYGDEEEYLFEEYEIGDLVAADTVQVQFYVLDMCGAWFNEYGDCAEHTSAPYIDNISLQRYGTEGPQWYCRDIDLFQDNFPAEEFNIESYVRADMADDMNPADDGIEPGDSIVVRCTSPLGGGIAEDSGGPRVYMHVKCTYIGAEPTKPDISGPSLEGTYGDYASDDGVWTIIQGETARIGENPLSGCYMFDLNDSLLTRGYMVEYYFKAFDNTGASSLYPASAASAPQTPYRLSSYLEFTCLPTLKSEILYVDDYHGIGTLDGIAQLYLYPDLLCTLPGESGVDRYDVNGPTSAASNGPGSRAKLYHLLQAYNVIVWDSGNLSTCTISEGTEHSDKSNDAQMLIDWLNLSEHDVGLWVMGDNVAADLDAASSTPALELMSSYCGVSLAHDSYFELTGGVDGGGIPNPFVTGVGEFADDSFYIFGGCPEINDFDVLETMAFGQYALQLPSFGEVDRYIGISCDQINAASYPMRTVWLGFSYMYIRPVEGNWFDRVDLILDVLHFFEIPWYPSVMPAEVPLVNSLGLNYPNPFNPATIISFSTAGKGKVTLRIYNVAGQLVRTMVDEVREAGRYTEVWDGQNDAKAEAASGVYFYRLEAGDFVKSRKMVLLR